MTLDGLADELAKGGNVELRNFGVFEIKVRKSRKGRNQNAPTNEVVIPIPCWQGTQGTHRKAKLAKLKKITVRKGYV